MTMFSHARTVPTRLRLPPSRRVTVYARHEDEPLVTITEVNNGVAHTRRTRQQRLGQSKLPA